MERDKIALDAIPHEQVSGQQAHGSKGQNPSEEPQPKKDPHLFDNLTKALFGLDGAKIIPELIPGVQVEAAYNIEIDRSKLKADLVFKILYKGLLAILNLEMQSGKDSYIGARLLQYIAGLRDFYKDLPILCVVIYLFKCQVEMPPYIIECADKRSIVFDYDVIKLWEVESEWIVERHLIPLYILLLATKAPTVDLMKKALHEMSQVYDRPQLAYRFRWFYSILRRTTTVTAENKRIIEKEFEVQFDYKELIQDDPVIQSLLAERELRGETRGKAEGEARGNAEGEARGNAEGRLEGRVEGLQESILNFLQARFPALAATSQVQQAVASIGDLEKLDLLQQALYIASDEQTVRRFLKLPVQGDLI